MSRRIAAVCLLLSLVAAAGFGQSLVVRGYGSVGWTVLPPSLESLDYDTRISWAQSYGLLNAGGGVQFVVPVGGLGIGIDAGFSTLYTLRIDNQAFLATNYYDVYKDASDYAYLNLIAEMSFSKLILVQVGAGICLDIWTYSWVNYYNTSVSDSSEDSGVDLHPDIMAAVGVEIPVAPRIKVFALARADVLFAYGVVIPVRVTIGATIGM
jgi:hypothetical protein